MSEHTPRIPCDLVVEKRDGEVAPFDKAKIEAAIARAAVAAGKSEIYIKDTINGLSDNVAKEVVERFSDGEFVPNVENIHDIVEKHLMRAELYEVAKAYILYRADKKRQSDAKRQKLSYLRKLTVLKGDGRTVLYNPKKVRETIQRCSVGLNGIDENTIFDEAAKNVYDGIKSTDVDRAIMLAATSFIEVEPDHAEFAARVYLQQMKKEVFGHSTDTKTEEAEEAYRESFVHAIELGVKAEIFDKRLLEFDLKELSSKLVLERDELFKFIGLDTLYERYFTKFDGRLFELPQTFWMRVAMGLAFNEEDKTKRALEFYEVMSRHLYIPSTPTLFHAGLLHPQLSSCYLTCVDDDLKDIFKSYADNSQLAKWSGGIGNDWTNVRSIGAAIKSTRVESQGTIPFLKIANDTTFAINRSGKRRGATVAYLEIWHYDYEDFLDLRRNTGDERRRTHDMNTASWIPDLFMKRVREGGEWTLFSPDETPDLHDLYGKAFEEAYVKYEKLAKRGKITKFKKVDAEKLYKRVVMMLYETGHPWPCFKDPCNIRSPQDHVGVVHSSNLCTEITLNTSPSRLVSQEMDWKTGQYTRKYDCGEVAVCNLGSLVLSNLMKGKKLDKKLTAWVIGIAMRMLDNVVDLNFYPTPEAEWSNLRHRPVGLGVMGLQDAMYIAGVNFERSHEFVDEIQEFVAYEAISNSCALAQERGCYETFQGSKWHRGIFPLDTLDLLEEERGMKIPTPRTTRLDWDKLKEAVKTMGMRNSNTMAIAPTATIATIVGCSPCIEPYFKNIFVKSNMTGEFTIVNEQLVRDLKKIGRWNKDMLDDLKYHDGSIQKLDLPEDMKLKYKESFEVSPRVAIELTALRGKWIDQSQSHNIFYHGKSGKEISEIYMYAWEQGLKTTYYLRCLGKTQIEKSTLDAGKYGFTQKRDRSETPDEPKLCKINDPDCEACQ